MKQCQEDVRFWWKIRKTTSVKLGDEQDQIKNPRRKRETEMQQEQGKKLELYEQGPQKNKWDSSWYQKIGFSFQTENSHCDDIEETCLYVICK